MLQPPSFISWSLQQAAQYVDNKSIDLNPKYQRNVVWDNAKQSALINSIWLGYYVPPIVLGFLPEDTSRWVCIDGKQRLTSIVRFRRNQIPLCVDESGYAYYYSAKPTHVDRGYVQEIFSPVQRIEFDSRSIAIVTIYGATDEIQREMFSRIQEGVPLKIGEKLYAKTGSAYDLAREFVGKYKHHIVQYVNDIRRDDFMFYLRVINFIYGGDITHTRVIKKQLNSISVTPSAREGIERLLDRTFTVLATDKCPTARGAVGLTIAVIAMSKCDNTSTDDCIALVNDVIDRIKLTNPKLANTSSVYREACNLISEV